MKIVMLPRIIDDNGTEIRENDNIIILTDKMADEAVAVVTEIGATFIVVRFMDILYGTEPIMLHTYEIKHLVKK